MWVLAVFGTDVGSESAYWFVYAVYCGEVL